jgi:hypothetical protein
MNFVHFSAIQFLFFDVVSVENAISKPSIKFKNVSQAFAKTGWKNLLYDKAIVQIERFLACSLEEGGVENFKMTSIRHCFASCLNLENENFGDKTCSYTPVAMKSVSSCKFM